MPDKPQPIWAYTEGLSDDIYRSQGIGECTGVQSLDFKEADTIARTNLSRMLAARIESEVLLTETYSGGTGQRGRGHTTGQVTSRQSTENLLEYSAIYDHWIDPDACTVHSAVKVSRQDIATAFRKQQEAFNAQLRNQEFMIVTQGRYGDVMHQGIAQMFSEAGINKLTLKRNKNTFLFKTRVTNNELLNNGKLVRVSIGLNIETPDGRIFWSQQVRGKGVSFGAVGRQKLTLMAVRNACENVITALRKILHHSVK